MQVTGRWFESTRLKLILPEVFEPVRRQSTIADRGHDRSVAEIGLDGAMDRLAALMRAPFHPELYEVAAVSFPL